MLDLLLYCHLFVRMRYPDHCDAVAAIVEEAMISCRDWLKQVLFGWKRHPYDRGGVVEQAFMAALDRLDAYVTSMA